MKSQGIHLRLELRQALWASMRRLRNFTGADLEASAECFEPEVSRWILMCRKAGFIAPASAGQKREARYRPWRLVRDSGPIPPRQIGASLFDANTDPAVADPELQMVQLPKAEYEHALKCVRACAGMADPERGVQELKARAGGTA